MILCIGEILADMIGDTAGGGLAFKSFCGGAPFNVAAAAKRAGAKTGFIGRVGRDPVGKFLIGQAEKVGFDRLDIQTDPERNTTLAFVTLKDGERDFAFYRHDTADFNIDLSNEDFCKDEDLRIVHLGSLMLSERAGRALAKSVADKARAAGKKLSFDLNFRMDIYKDFNDAKKAYAPFVECADVIKFSDDELKDYTGIENVNEAIDSLNRSDALIVVTMGAKGSLYFYGNVSGAVASEKVKPVDTTGAGDAFFGTFLANIENVPLTKQNIEAALVKANRAGAETTQFLGAIKL